MSLSKTKILNKINIEYVSINNIKPNEYNPKQITQKQFEDLKKSITEFGIVDPLIVNKAKGREGIIIGGHQRYKIYQELKIEEIPVIYVEINNIQKEKELCIRLSKNTGEWDWDLLANLFNENDLISWGFTEDELFMLNNVTEKVPDNKADDIPEAPEVVITRPGDIWKLGRHKLLCGDSTNIDDVKNLMAGEKAVLGFTSPPYWVGKEYEKEKSVEEINEFIRNICISYNMAVRKDKSRIVINTSTGFTTSFDKKNKRQVLLLIDKWTNYFSELGWNLRHIRHWLKEGQLVSISPKSDIIDQHCEFFGTYENDEGEDMVFDDVLNEDDINILETFYNREGENRGQIKTGKKWALRSYWADIKGNANQEKHCASFPVEIVLRHILLYTKRNEIVLDLFGGAGTTIIAAEISNRIAYVCEISPNYCDIALERWALYTGKEPVREDGRKWSELKDELGNQN